MIIFWTVHISLTVFFFISFFYSQYKLCEIIVLGILGNGGAGGVVKFLDDWQRGKNYNSELGDKCE